MKSKPELFYLNTFRKEEVKESKKISAIIIVAAFISVLMFFDLLWIWLA